MYTNWNGELLPIKSVKFKIVVGDKSMLVDSKFRDGVTLEEIHDTVKLLRKHKELLAIRC